MQWEGKKTKVGASKPTAKKRDTEVGGGDEMGSESKENISWADHNTSPLAMRFNQTNGWTAETLGSNSGHWKRIMRQKSKPSPTKKVSSRK